MSNLKLVADEPTPLEKLLLDASRAEQASQEHKAKLRAALGLGLPVSGPLAAPPPTPAPLPVSPPAPAPQMGGKLLGAKVAAGVAALAAVGALIWSQSASPPASPARVMPDRVVTPPTTAPVAPPAEAVVVSPLPPLERAAEVAPRQRTAAPAPAASADLSEQIRLIEAARSGVASRDAKAALAALDSYSAKFPRGAFGQEAMVLRIRAVDQAGDFARATALAKAFVTRFPQSPHVARLKPIAERGASK